MVENLNTTWVSVGREPLVNLWGMNTGLTRLLEDLNNLVASRAIMKVKPFEVNDQDNAGETAIKCTIYDTSRSQNPSTKDVYLRIQFSRDHGYELRSDGLEQDFKCATKSWSKVISGVNKFIAEIEFEHDTNLRSAMPTRKHEPVDPRLLPRY